MFLLELTLIVAAGVSPLSAREPDRAPPGYTKVFADEFDSEAIDPAAWRFDVSRNAAGWYNQEKQYYADGRRENSRVEQGRLIIEARQETLDKAHFPDWGGQKYSSARMVSQAKVGFTYGFFEIRAKLPCGRGTWPAIWMLPADTKVEWPTGGEIDIMEHVGFDPGVIHQTIITSAFNFNSGSEQTKAFPVADACTAMHRYQLLWTPDFIVSGIDDNPKFMFKKVRTSRDRWPFDQPMQIILNVAVGGSWGGQKGIDPAAFPARMEVDYVRVYQRPAAPLKSGEQ